MPEALDPARRVDEGGGGTHKALLTV